MFICLGCQNERYTTLQDLNCDSDLKTFEIPYNVPIGYDKATSMVKGSDNKLVLFTLENNKQYKLIGSEGELNIGQNFQRGKYFTMYNDGHLFVFNSPFVREYFNDSLIHQYEITNSLSFFGGMQNRPIITPEYIVASVYPNSELTSNLQQYIRLLHEGPLFIMIHRSSGKNKVLGNYPTEVFPYYQNEERKYNGLEHSYHFCVIDQDIYFMFKTSHMLYRVNSETGIQSTVTEFNHNAFKDVGKNPADESWETIEKGTYIACSSHVRKFVPIKNNSELETFVTEKQIYTDKYLDQLANNSFLVLYNLEKQNVSDVIYIDEHFPYILYSDDAIILLRQRKEGHNEQENNVTRFTVVPHECL